MNAIIIDDHPLARIAIRNLLDSNGITVAAELDSGAHAVQTAESMQPDLLIVDVDIPELSGIEVLEQLRKRRYQGTIIIISAKNELFYGKRSADCGANGFVSKKEGMNNILAAIEAANNGYSYFPFHWNASAPTASRSGPAGYAVNAGDEGVPLYSQRRRLHHHRQQNEHQQ